MIPPAEIAAGFSDSDFDFANNAVTALAPGAFFVIPRAIQAFALRYGTGLPVAGEYGGDKLSKGGDDIEWRSRSLPISLHGRMPVQIFIRKRTMAMAGR